MKMRKLPDLPSRVYSPSEPGRNEPCPCGSGFKYKKCHQRVRTEIKAGPKAYQNLSVRELVLNEIQSFKEIFEIKLTDKEIRIKEKIRDSDVHLFFEKVSNIWNSKQDLITELPTAVDLRFRALYFGSPDMLSTANLVARYSLYCDQLLIIDPFGNFREFRRDHKDSIAKNPQGWVRQIIRDGIYLCSLEDWIESGLLVATAFPLRFNDALRQEHIKRMSESAKLVGEEQWNEMTEEAFENEFLANFTPMELETMQQSKPEELEKLRRSLDKPEVLALLQQAFPGASKESLSQTIENSLRRYWQVQAVKNRLEKEPKRYQWALASQFQTQYSLTGPGMNFEDAMWLAARTGSHLVTNRKTIWNQIHAGREGSQAGYSVDVNRALSSLAEAFQALEFKFLNDVPLDFALRIRKEGRLSGLRTYLRDFWNKFEVEGLSESARLDVIREFQDRLSTEYAKFRLDFEEIERAVTAKVTVGGITGAGAVISGNLQLALASVGFLSTALTDRAKVESKRANALSVFLDLDRVCSS